MSEFRRTLHSITLAGAKRVRDHARLKAAELGIEVSVVVVNRTGTLVLVETTDGAAAGASEASIMKAKGAARYGVATHKTAEYLKHLSPALAQHALSLPDACAFQGGAPIHMDGELLGGVGVSGGSGEQDVEIALGAAGSIANP
jgi:uncharacterized protein GlcG (DUF336 family)